LNVFLHQQAPLYASFEKTSASNCSENISGY